MNVPNPMNNPVDLSFIFNIPSEELLKVAVAGMIGVGLLVYWLSKKVNQFDNDTNHIGSYKFDV